MNPYNLREITWPWVLQEGSPREADTLDRRLVDEPAASLAGSLVDQGTGQVVVGVEDLLHDVFLAGAGGDKGNAHSVSDDGQGEGDALCGGLGGILNGGDPCACLPQQGVAGKEGAGVAVGAAAEEDEVEDGETDRVAAGKAGHKRLLVLVGELLDVVEMCGVDGVDCGLLVLGDLVEELLL